MPAVDETVYQAALRVSPAQAQQWADTAQQTLRASFCERCLHPILWVTNHATGKVQPIDKKPNPEGRIVFVSWDLIHHLKHGEEAPGGAAAPRFMSHFATCPFASSFRS